ncbi:MAG TPA: PKD domain-containing protein [bacterium]|jgi:hypothetical protein
MYRPLHYLLVLVLLALVLGCSSGSNDPFTPSLTPELNTQADTVPQNSFKDLWGWWEVQLDVDNQTAEIIPMRGAMFRANVTQWLQPPAGKLSNLKIDVVDVSNYFTDGSIDVDVTLFHPFPGFIIYTGFDVHGVFMHNGTVSDSVDGSLTYNIDNSSGAILKNADGMTRWFNSSEFSGGIPILGYTPGALGNIDNPTATLNPYKYFADGLGNTDEMRSFYLANYENRGMFASGAANTRRYELQFEHDGVSPILTYQYAVIASWEEPDPALSGDPDIVDVPSDFPVTANQLEPIHIAVEDLSTLWYANDADKGGELRLKVEIFRPDFGPIMPNKMRISSCSSCGIYPVVVEYDAAQLEAMKNLSGISPVSSIYEVEIGGIDPTASGMASYLIEVEPNEPATYDQGFGMPNPEGAALAAYMLGWVNIGTQQGCTPPVAYAEATSSTEIAAGNTVDFDASGTTGTPPLEWEWDWDGDGTYDETTQSATITHQFDDAGLFDVMCKATNPCGEDEIDEPITIAVCGSGIPVYDTTFAGTTGAPYYYMDLEATVNDPNPKLVAPGAFSSPTTERRIMLASITNPSVTVASYEYTGTGQIGSGLGRTFVDGSDPGIDRIFFVSNTSASQPNYVEWNGSSFSNETTLPSCGSGIWSLTVTDEGDVIAHNSIGPTSSVFMWDKSNGYSCSTIFTFTNTAGSVPYGNFGNLLKIAYDPATELVLFPVSNNLVSTGGQLYGFTLAGVRDFADTNVYEANVNPGSFQLGVTVDYSSPTCRVLFHGNPNGTLFWSARYSNGLTGKTIMQTTMPADSYGGKSGAFAGDYFFTNTNNWNYWAIRRPLPTDW